MAIRDPRAPRSAKEMLSVRISATLYDRLRLYVATHKANIQDIVEESVGAWLDAADPFGKESRRLQAASAAPVKGSQPEDRIAALENKVDRLLDALTQKRAAR